MQTPAEPATGAELAIDLLQQVKINPVVVTPIIEILRDHTAIGRFIDPSIEESQFSTWLAVIRDLLNIAVYIKRLTLPLPGMTASMRIRRKTIAAIIREA
jgi:hypothetical protein